MAYVISGNRTVDGAVIYLAVGQRWVLSLAESWVLDTDQQRDEQLAWSQAHERDVCDPYAVDVKVADGRPEPISAREIIRARGSRPLIESMGHASSNSKPHV